MIQIVFSTYLRIRRPRSLVADDVQAANHYDHCSADEGPFVRYQPEHRKSTRQGFPPARGFRLDVALRLSRIASGRNPAAEANAKFPTLAFL
jgi:hypothetical protein